MKRGTLRSFASGLAAALLLASASAALADDAQIRRALEPKLGGAKIEGIQPAPMAGLFEVRLQTADGPQIVYTDAAGTYVIQGSIISLVTGRDLTEERLRKLSTIKFESLPLDQAIKIQRGDGRRVMAMFSDPYCPYCQQFEKTLRQVDNVTVYVFMYPVIRPQNADHSREVWCSTDRAKAWLDLALDHKRASASPRCATPIEKNLELGRALRVNSTPTLFLSNGERIAGGLPLADLQDVLDQASAKPEKKAKR
ncbi:MAG TPA: DsbC family protein [Burkholderiales bacterium]|jgi:thiol:disulfide interchange protein DsbC